MRVPKENVNLQMAIPGAAIRQQTDFGDATGLGRISAEVFSLAAGVDTTPTGCRRRRRPTNCSIGLRATTCASTTTPSGSCSARNMSTAA